MSSFLSRAPLASPSNSANHRSRFSELILSRFSSSAALSYVGKQARFFGPAEPPKRLIGRGLINWRLRPRSLCRLAFDIGALSLQLLQLLVLFEREQPLCLCLNLVLRAVSLQ